MDKVVATISIQGLAEILNELTIFDGRDQEREMFLLRLAELKKYEENMEQIIKLLESYDASNFEDNGSCIRDWDDEDIGMKVEKNLRKDDAHWFI